jgi:hypothetical protein
MSPLNSRITALAAYLAGTCVAYGQRFTYGVMGGASTIEPTQANQDESRRYVVGGALEVSLFRGFAVETDFFYRHNGFSGQFNFVPGIFSGASVVPISASDRIRLDVFELPVVGKYYFLRDAKVQPFVLTGFSFRKAFTNVDSSSTYNNNGVVSTTNSNSSYWTPTNVGATVGAGLNWRFGRVAVSPQFRYTFWGATPNQGLSKQQADVLVGITF